MWAALRDGAGLADVLTDFYTRVYADPRLSPFFKFTTMRRAVEKQYSFLKEIFTGEECYFGDRPYNAHHWMVVSDELFDYRESLMGDCLLRYGLPDHLIRRFRAVDEMFRKQIVKATPKPRKLRGIDLPLEGFSDVTISAGTLCDGCERPIDAGQKARYHVRTGQAYCPACSVDKEDAVPDGSSWE